MKAVKLLREPLLHFLVIGAVLFGAYQWTSGDEAAPDEIVVSAGQIASLQAIFSKTWQRPPTDKETEALVNEHIRDEILYREGVAMGLDRDDTIVRRRIRQKMESVADLSADAQPTDVELKAFVAEHPEWFRAEPRVSFSHVYFQSGAEGRPSGPEVATLLQALNDGKADASQAGDPFMAGFDFRDLPRSQVAQIFGESFAVSMDSAGSGSWEGPVVSAYGAHLVRVSERVEAREPPFEDVREVARREWLHLRKVQANDALYEKLRSRYVIKIDPQATAEKLAGAAQ